MNEQVNKMATDEAGQKLVFVNDIEKFEELKES
jgi:hypothetical protein